MAVGVNKVYLKLDLGSPVNVKFIWLFAYYSSYTEVNVFVGNDSYSDDFNNING